MRSATASSALDQVQQGLIHHSCTSVKAFGEHQCSRNASGSLVRLARRRCNGARRPFAPLLVMSRSVRAAAHRSSWRVLMITPRWRSDRRNTRRSRGAESAEELPPDPLGPAPPVSPIIALSPHCGQSIARDAIGTAFLAADETPPAETLEHRECAVTQPPAVAVDAVDFDNVAFVVLAMMNRAALRQRVQRSLLVL